MGKTNEILTIAGKRVIVEHAKFGDDTCAKCCFGDTDLCHGVDAVFPCERFDFETAYFVNADEIGVEYCEQNCKGFQETGRCFADGECDAKKAEKIEGVSQEVTLIPSNEDEDEAAEKYGKEHTILPDDYNDGDIPVYEGWTAEAFKDGIQWMRRRLMKEAVECEIGWSDGYRIAPADENSMNEALAKIGVLDQVGAGVDAKVSAIIIKKEK